MATEIRVTRMMKLPSADQQRLGKLDTFVYYTGPDAKPAVCRVSSEGMTEATLIAAIKADLAARAEWEGRTLQIP